MPDSPMGIEPDSMLIEQMGCKKTIPAWQLQRVMIQGAFVFLKKVLSKMYYIQTSSFLQKVVMVRVSSTLDEQRRRNSLLHPLANRATGTRSRFYPSQGVHRQLFIPEEFQFLRVASFLSGNALQWGKSAGAPLR